MPHPCSRKHQGQQSLALYNPTNSLPIYAPGHFVNRVAIEAIRYLTPEEFPTSSKIWKGEIFPHLGSLDCSYGSRHVAIINATCHAYGLSNSPTC